MQAADVIVGNGLYQYGDRKVQIYRNLQTMQYLVRKKMLIEIRNLIPAPGECMIRKDIIPLVWLDTAIQTNGADDWYLWILLFKSGARFLCNEQLVYIHNDAGGKNLSLDLHKMYVSGLEMYEALKGILSEKEHRLLKNAICFKYKQDTKQLKLADLVKYRDIIIKNIIYKINVLIRGIYK